MIIFLTGATGYIGHKLALSAVEKGHRIHILVRDPSSPFLPSHPEIRVFRGDITDTLAVETAMRGCDALLHTAALTRLRCKDPDAFYRVNVEGTCVLLDAALRLGVRKFVYTSTGGVLGPSLGHPLTEADPRITAFENDYEISKYLAEQEVIRYAEKGLGAVIVATSRVYGPGLPANGNVFGRLLRRILSMGVAFMPARKEVLANYAFIDDVVEGHFLALEKGQPGEKYILGGENLSYEVFFRQVIFEAGKKIRLFRVPTSLLLAWSWLHMMLYRFTGRETNISPAIVRRLNQHRALSCEKARNRLGYTITPFPEGIRRTLASLNP